MKQEEDEEKERDDTPMSGKELFGGMLGSGDADDLKAAKEKKLIEKRALIQKIKKEKQQI